MRLENKPSNEKEIEIDIDQIMREIRTEIYSHKQRMAEEGELVLSLNGNRFSSKFYETLYQAGVGFSDLTIQPNVTKSSTPLIGPLIDRVRLAIHNLVLFYVNQLAAEQAAFNRLIVRAVNQLSQELESELKDSDRSE